ncbi:hypothetical protein VTJ04DRAFT_1613 [Mycothermus thermophilus]|uniref:uncharacterized protein n=1 Tax=Humicola insolens TaxID=85995 RepID=UPI0037425DC6
MAEVPPQQYPATAPATVPNGQPGTVTAQPVPVPPGWVYDDTNIYRHRDYAGRVTKKPKSDRYLNHKDGKLRNLIVQCTDEIFRGPRIRHGNGPAFALVFCFWSFGDGRVENQGCYAPVPYYFHGDAKVWGNLLENLYYQDVRPALATNNHVYRLLKPRYLCFLNNPYDAKQPGVHIRSVSEWEQEVAAHGNVNLNYLFVAWSTRQFSVHSQEDMMALLQLAERACREANLPAFWISSHCMIDPRELEEDVYRISDIVRGAQKMVIIVGPPPQSYPGQVAVDTDSLLQQWGSRLWTFPEILLSPGNSVSVYNRALGPDSPPLVITKNQFAARVWADTDASLSGQLLDHYAGKLELTRLELSVILLKCLFTCHTNTWLPGDHSYALMGLLHLRPKVDKDDSAFQAFARISLSNDSDQLLERAISILPATGPSQPWHDFSDAYGSQLWDIAPTCQVAGVCGDDTVILDGARGASIRWKSFYYVAFSTKFSWKRLISLFLLQYQGYFFIAGVAIAATISSTSKAGSSSSSSSYTRGSSYYGSGSAPSSGGVSSSGAKAAAALCFLIWIWLWLLTPNLVRTCLGGKLTDVQAALFGFEGYLNAPTVERAIFGGNFNRLGWSVNGSPLSRSYVNEHGERIAVDPTKDPNVKAKVEQAMRATGPGQMRIFTLVDTYNMQMTLFEAERPPVCLFLCGAEGGMQRAVACSYDFTTGTFYRETVLRMPTTSLNRMDRTSRIKLGLSRPVGWFQVRPAAPPIVPMMPVPPGASQV